MVSSTEEKGPSEKTHVKSRETFNFPFSSHGNVLIECIKAQY